MELWWLLVAIVLFAFFDVHYFIQGVLQYIECQWLKQSGKYNIFSEVVTTGTCMTNDLDFQLHMNNSRYLRECDFGRFKLWLLSGVWDTIKKLSGQVTMGSSTIRYRKSLKLGQKYAIKTKVMCWDERAFYVEQRIVRPSDQFIMAIVYAKQSIIKVTPAEVVTDIMGHPVDSPQIPEHVQKFIECHQLSSEILKKESS